MKYTINNIYNIYLLIIFIWQDFEPLDLDSWMEKKIYQTLMLDL